MFDKKDQPWCSTEVDSNGNYVKGLWGYCDTECKGKSKIVAGNVLEIWIYGCRSILKSSGSQNSGRT